MKTTVDLPDELLKEAKAVAARRGETLRELFAVAIEDHLGQREDESRRPQMGWRAAFGLARQGEIGPVDRIISRECEVIDIEDRSR